MKKKVAPAPMTTAAAPIPAPRPAARAVVLVAGLAVDDADADADADADGEAVVWPASGDPDALFVGVVAVPVSVLVLVPCAAMLPAVTVLLTKPDQVVEPITVAVTGCVAPSLSASLPVSQLQLGSLGQQYQSWPSALLHLMSGIEVVASDQLC